MNNMSKARYENAMIYRLINEVDDQFYIGSTCMPLAKRKCQHKAAAKRHLTRRVYEHMNKIGWEFVKIILIEKFPCEDKYELEKRERYFIEEMKPPLNSIIPTRSPICEHGRQRPKCKECGGASICEHGRERSKCKDCGGTSICEHGRQRPQCKECGGASICEHGRERAKCKACGGASICEHGRQRSQCKDCKPSIDERVYCGCGSIYKYKCRFSHVKTQRHKKWLETQDEAIIELEEVVIDQVDI
jgi:predicted GIY-YIG superfamily endonuclease